MAFLVWYRSAATRMTLRIYFLGAILLLVGGGALPSFYQPSFKHHDRTKFNDYFAIYTCSLSVLYAIICINFLHLTAAMVLESRAFKAQLEIKVWKFKVWNYLFKLYFLILPNQISVIVQKMTFIMQQYSKTAGFIVSLIAVLAFSGVYVHILVAAMKVNAGIERPTLSFLMGLIMGLALILAEISARWYDLLAQLVGPGFAFVLLTLTEVLEVYMGADNPGPGTGGENQAPDDRQVQAQPGVIQLVPNFPAQAQSGEIQEVPIFPAHAQPGEIHPVPIFPAQAQPPQDDEEDQTEELPIPNFPPQTPYWSLTSASLPSPNASPSTSPSPFPSPSAFWTPSQGPI